MVLPGGQRDYDCDRGLVCGGGVLDGLRFAYYITRRVNWYILETNSEMSPTIFREAGFRFYFFSREDPRIHVHVQNQHGEAKFWLTPHI